MKLTVTRIVSIASSPEGSVAVTKTLSCPNMLGLKDRFRSSLSTIACTTPAPTVLTLKFNESPSLS